MTAIALQASASVPTMSALSVARAWGGAVAFAALAIGVGGAAAHEAAGAPHLHIDTPLGEAIAPLLAVAAVAMGLLALLIGGGPGGPRRRARRVRVKRDDRGGPK